MKTLYEEQEEARYIGNGYLNKKISSVFVSPCGTGKTVTASAIIVDRVNLGKRVFILVPQVEILNQWIEELTVWGLNPGYCNDEGFRGKNRSVYVCMYQSLVGKLSYLPESIYPDEIIVDETQHILCPSIIDICTFFESATRLGLTATLYHNSGQTFRTWYTEYFQTITKAQAIKKGYITEPILIEPENYLKNADIPILGEDYDPEKQAALLGETRIYGNFLEDYDRLFAGRPVIIPCATFEQAKTIKELFCSSGWNFEHVHSDRMSKHERNRILKGIADQKINGLCTVGIGVEGLSIKGLWGVMWACRTMSPIRWTQFNGRGERLYPGKDYCIDLDYVGNAIIHGHPSDERKWNLDGEELDDEEDKVPFIKCCSCGTYNNPENTECHWCGVNFSDKPDSAGQGRRLPAIIDGKLVAITTDGQRTEILTRSEEKKAEIKREIEEREARKNNAEPITAVDKRKKMTKGLFASSSRRELFRERLMDY
jgi:superfamily II DNA or RNA helicase